MQGPMLERRDLIRGLTALGALTMLPPAAFARKSPADWSPVRNYIDGLISPEKIPGLLGTIGVGNAEPTYIAAGTIAKDSRTPVGPDTLWRVYSMTKPISGMAAMMLIEQGKLKLDQNIADFIPGFANPKVLVDPAKDLTSRPAQGPITIRHLLTHTAGLGYTIVTKGPLLQEYVRLGINPTSVSRTKFPGYSDIPTAPSLAEFADRLATLPLLFDPGAQWRYSVGLDLLGRIIELASGKSFDGFLQERMFDPLGMKDTFWQVPQKDVGRFVTGYMATPAITLVIDPAATSIYLDKPAFPFGGSGLVMSARDYDRFLWMLQGHGAIGKVRVMAPATARLGMSNLLPAGVDTSGTILKGNGFGAGGGVATKSGPGDRGPGSFGWGGAAATIAWVDPAQGIRATGFAQYAPEETFGFPDGYTKAVYASL
ncbi:MAG: serine hydrolase domain-containing protein [Pseudomonadota bacterium]|uniref:serine hydrolase domain-containing protein n=1 Tax=Sphingomonas sp. ERG5 TaxID=1381597 RepID=UPI000B0A3741|nr:serine hydrolase domain-containing protein [Sphingomonas sp. ERG5]